MPNVRRERQGAGGSVELDQAQCRAVIICGDSLEVLRGMQDASVDAVVTDPPYGLKFMNKHWDYDVPSVELWREVLRVLKPGGHLLSFAGSRTYHRIATAIEDAGFEIRDQIQWLYGSGFPKSLDVSKAIDKAAGAEREVVGTRKASLGIQDHGREAKYKREGIGENPVYGAPATDAAKQWQGWGTALKPAFEPVVCARKPLTGVALVNSLAHECLRSLSAEVAKYSSRLSLSDDTRRGIARWTAEGVTLTPAVLFEAMGTLPFEWAQDSSLSTGLSWLSTLADHLIDESMFTTETLSSLTIDLRTLKSSLSRLTLVTTDQSGGPGEPCNVSLVVNLLSALGTKCDFILTHSVRESATGEDDPLNLRPDARPIVVARKPFDGPLYKNVLEFGTGALNIDASRVGTDVRQNAQKSMAIDNQGFGGIARGAVGVKQRTSGYLEVSGRWPANVVLGCDCADDDGQLALIHREDCPVAMLNAQSGISKSAGGRTVKRSGKYEEGKISAPGEWSNEDPGFGDTGGASRFFYVAKASKAERNRGCEGMPEKDPPGSKRSTPADGRQSALGAARANHHPTVKPIKLMQYLIRLVCPSAGVVLDPFMGSGSTGVAAVESGYQFIGVERESEYAAIAEARIKHARSKGSRGA